MSKFLNLVTAANAASASAAYELKQQQEDYAQEAWERDQAGQEREAEKEIERELRQATAAEKTERNRRWDYRTEGIRGGIEAILKYRDPRFRLKLLEWHKEGELRTDKEIDRINSLMKNIGDSIVNEALNSIDNGEYDETAHCGEETIARFGDDLTDEMLVSLTRNNRLVTLRRDDVVRNGCLSVGVMKRLDEMSRNYEEQDKQIMDYLTKLHRKKGQEEALDREIEELKMLRKFPQKILGGVIGWQCRNTLDGSWKWWVRLLLLFLNFGLWPIVVPCYLFLWLKIARRVNDDYRRLWRAKIAAEAY